MRNNTTYRILLAGGLLLLASSCIKDEDLRPCPPLMVTIEVKDKNYFNIGAVESEQRRDENLPFKAYVPTLYYRLQRIDDDGTATLMTEHRLAEVEGDERSIEVVFPDAYPHGKYVMTTWGGLHDMAALDEKREQVTFHPQNRGGDDIYMSHDTLIYDAYRHDYSVELERTKGKLIVEGKDLPLEIHYATKQIASVARHMDLAFRYWEPTFLHEENDWEGQQHVVFKTLASPSLTEHGTQVTIRCYDSPQHDVALLSPPPVKLSIERNRLSAIRYVYEGQDRFKVYVLVNDNWELIHDMDIE